MPRGRSVELDAVAVSGGSNPVVAWRGVRMGADGPLPTPLSPSPLQLISEEFQFRYVEIEGTVRSVFIDHTGRLAMSVRALGRDVQVRVRDMPPSGFHLPVDSVVRVRGVLVTAFDAGGAANAVKVFVATFGELAVTKPGPAAADVPLLTVRSVLSRDSSSSSGHRVRLRGSVWRQSGRLELRDSTGLLRLRPVEPEAIGVGGPFDIVGFVDQEGDTPVLTECTVVDWARERGAAAPLPLLTTVAQVKKLSESQARQRYPVHLRAVVTHHNPVINNTFAQDETGGIYLFIPRGAAPDLAHGDLIEIDGSAAPGEFVPIVSVSRFRVIGKRALPAPAPVEMEQLFTGIADSEWVEVRGVVHAIGQESGAPALSVNWGAHHFTAYVYGSTKLPDSLLDAHVRIQGVCGSRFNFKRQILGIQIFVPDAGLIRIEGDGTPQAPSLRAIGELLQFSSSSGSGERARIRGVVTLANPTGPTYVSDSSGAVLIQNHARADLKVGDSVEATGLAVAVPGRFNPALRDAGIRKLGEGTLAEPRLMTVSEVLDEGYDSELVRIDAALVSQAGGREHQALVLQAGDQVFEALLDQSRLPAFETGSLLRVTGIASVETHESQQTVVPRRFSILLRSPADIVVLRAAPWWTAGRAVRMLGLVSIAALLSLMWIVVLRRRVRAQTADLRKSRQMLRLVLDHIPERVFWKDRAGRYLGCNQPCADDAGLPASEAIVGLTDYDLAWRSNAGAYETDDRQVMDSGKPKTGYEEPLVGSNGSLRWLRTSKAPLHGPEGEVIGLLGVYEDITERKRAEQRLQQYSLQLAETNEELRRFTYIVSHDLRAPLVSLRGFTAELRHSFEALKDSIESLLPNLEQPRRGVATQALGEDAPEALGFIESSVTRMDHLISALLRLSRVGHQELVMEKLDPERLLQDTLRALAHQIESRHVEVKIGPLPGITSDRTAIEQIFGNLLDNALKYLDLQRPAEIEVSAEETAEAVVFRVRDTGRGIAEDDMDKVFAPFRRAGAQDVPGEGMGLAYVRALLTRLGGRIECRSQLGVGTTFSFTLPKVR